MRWHEGVASDVRWALRGMRRQPTFALVAVLTLALGIGANTAVFTLASAHFLSPLPYDRPDELVLLWETARDTRAVRTVAPGNYYDWREQAESFTDVAAFNVSRATLSGDGAAERVAASVVTPRFFEVLGVVPALGIGFTEEGARAADGSQVVLSHSLWARRYGSDPSVVGTDIRVNGHPHTVTGILPSEFRQPERSLSWQNAEIWRPLLLDDQRDDHGSRYLRTIARRRPGVTVEQAQREMDLLAERQAEAYPVDNNGRGVLVRTLDDYLTADARPTLIMLLVAGAAVLMIVCANVANMTLARGQRRRLEFAVRAALGSGQRRLVRQVVVEGLVLALAGAALGLALVLGSQGPLQAIQERYFSGLISIEVGPKVIGITLLAAVLVGVLLALPSALVSSRADLRSSLVEGGNRSGTGPKTGAARSLLVVAQVAMATGLIVIASLLSRSFNTLVNTSPGFAADGVITFSVAAPASSYPERADIEAYFREVWSALEAVPGVTAVGMTSDLPFTTENRSTNIRIEGLAYDPANPTSVEFHTVLPEYFEVLQISVLSGELPRQGWDAPGEAPVVINARMAEAFWPGGDPVGQGITLDWSESVPLRVVAVVDNVLDDGYAASPDLSLFVPWGANPQRSMSVVVRTSGVPADASAALRTAVAGVDPDVPPAGLRTLEGMLAESVSRPRAASLIGGIFAVVAMLIAAVGIYGVLNYAVQSRLREIAIRSALGATASQLVSRVVGQSARLLALGLALGFLMALVASSAMTGLLFRVSPFDIPSFLIAAALLGVVGTFAASVPALRAVAVDPSEALRSD